MAKQPAPERHPTHPCFLGNAGIPGAGLCAWRHQHRRQAARRAGEELRHPVTGGTKHGGRTCSLTWRRSITPATQDHYTARSPLQFLDAVSVLYRWDIREAKALWGAWHGKARTETAFRELQRRSLVDVGRDEDSEFLDIHDVVRALGAGILRDPARDPCYYGSRMWSGGGMELRNWSQVRALTRPRAFAGFLCASSPADTLAPPAGATCAAGGCCNGGYKRDAARTARHEPWAPEDAALQWRPGGLRRPMTWGVLVRCCLPANE
jgi:hypothetical protein